MKNWLVNSVNNRRHDIEPITSTKLPSYGSWELPIQVFLFTSDNFPTIFAMHFYLHFSYVSFLFLFSSIVLCQKIHILVLSSFRFSYSTGLTYKCQFWVVSDCLSRNECGSTAMKTYLMSVLFICPVDGKSHNRRRLGYVKSWDISRCSFIARREEIGCYLIGHIIFERRTVVI